MDIVFLVHQFFPEYHTGTERALLNAALATQKFGHRVKVVTYRIHGDSSLRPHTDNILVGNYTYRGIPVTAVQHAVQPPRLNVSTHDAALAKVAETIAAKEHPDLVHVFHPMRVTEFVRAFQRQNTPTILTLTDFWLMCPKVYLTTSEGGLCRGPKKGLVCSTRCSELSPTYIGDRLRSTQELLRSATRITAPSHFLANLFEEEFAGLNIDVIGHGISYKSLRRNRKQYRRDSHLTFGFAGSLNWYKGAQILLDAFMQLPSDRVSLHIYGSGEDTDKLKRQAANDSRIKFKGVYRDVDLGDVFSELDVLVIPSLTYESYSLVLHEAMACQVPVIVPNIGEFPRKVEDHVHGLRFPLGDKAELGRRMDEIVKNPEVLNGWKYNLSTLTIPTTEQEAYAYEQLYQAIRSR